MTRDEFYDKVAAIVKQLDDLVNELPTIPELDDDNETDSKSAYESVIYSLECDLDYLSDDYFDKA